MLKKKKGKDSQIKEINMEYENLKKELLQLLRYLNFKNSGFNKRFLKNIIKKYFEN